MPKVIWEDVIIAESDETVFLEGNHYFPPSSVEKKYLVDSSKTSTCFWKGDANYFDISVNGKTLEESAWVYLEPLKAASEIKDYVAFWGTICIES